jgi:hypothetical protein
MVQSPLPDDSKKRLNDYTILFAHSPFRFAFVVFFLTTQNVSDKLFAEPGTNLKTTGGTPDEPAF